MRLSLPTSVTIYLNLLNDSQSHTEGAHAAGAKALQGDLELGLHHIAVQGSEVQQPVCTAPTSGWVSKLLGAQTGGSGSPDVGRILQQR